MLRGEELVPHREFTLEGKGLREWFLATFPSGFGCERRSLIERLGVFQEFDRIYLACQPVEYWLGLESLGRLMVRFEGGAERAPSVWITCHHPAVCPAELTVKRTSFPASSRVGKVKAEFFLPEELWFARSGCRLGNLVPSVIRLSESSDWEFIEFKRGTTATS